jgi:hypothetical protein
MNETKERGLLDDLISASKLYSSSEGYKQLLEFVVKLRTFAPFNAMLLHIQKPGLNYAASARDWRERFKRSIKPDARPLLILWPFAPVALVYDVQDTEGAEIPARAFGFTASGTINELKLSQMKDALEHFHISVKEIDGGADKAGSIRLTHEAQGKEPRKYSVSLNSNYSPAAKFATLVHELGHLWLGHLGSDTHLKIQARVGLSHDLREIEAESVAYILCKRNGVDVHSEQYLSGFINGDTWLDNLEIHKILQAAGQAETKLGLSERISWDRKSSVQSALFGDDD